MRRYQKPSPVELTVVPAMWGEQTVTKLRELGKYFVCSDQGKLLLTMRDSLTLLKRNNSSVSKINIIYLNIYFPIRNFLIYPQHTIQKSCAPLVNLVK